VWGTITTQRTQLVHPFEKLADEGAELLGRDTPGGRRMRETAEFYAFFRQKMAEFVKQWQAYRQNLHNHPGG
jgi:hypothetical protein